MPPTPRNDPARPDYADVLARGRQLIDRGDVAGYWALIAEHDPYAKLAHGVATNSTPEGRAANERLANYYRRQHGRNITDAEIEDIRRKIANADAEARRKSMEAENNIGLKPDTIAGYHKTVFEQSELPSDTFTLENLGRAFGDDAAGWHLGTEEPSSADRGDGSIDAIGDAIGDVIGAGLDAVFSDGEPDPIRGGPGGSPDYRGPSAPSRGKPSDAEGTPGRAPDDGSRAGAAPRGADAAGSPRHDAAVAATGADAGPSAVPRAAEADAEPWRDAWARALDLPAEGPPRAETILLKQPADWTEGEMRAVLRSDAYWTGEEGERTRRRDAVARWHGLHYGDAPVRRDGTGRMVEPAFKIDPPAAVTPPRTVEGEPLADALSGTLAAVGRQAKSAGPMEAVRRLQAGLNRMTGRAAAQPKPDRRRLRDPCEDEPTPRVERLRVDGDLGPKTAEAARRAVARFGRKPVEAELRRPAEEQEPNPLFALNEDAQAGGRRPISGGFRARG
ncbi:MAG: hypothetical protein RIB45_01490 [Marivibrio sp.]|uniref:hypothetical protein n=1 Tax=Marivibrio sp. TaxID=2039719 RepID=UPI0032EBD1AB